MGQKTGTSRIRKNVRKKAMAVILVAEYLLQKKWERTRGEKEGGERGGRERGERRTHFRLELPRGIPGQYTAIRYVI